jgi:hypothetical protein
MSGMGMRANKLNVDDSLDVILFECLQMTDDRYLCCRERRDYDKLMHHFVLWYGTYLAVYVFLVFETL